jgi:flagellar hook-basal body complex protein FliE
MVIKGIQGGFNIGQAMPLPSVKQAKSAAVAEGGGKVAEGGGKFLGELVSKVNDLQKHADLEIQKLSTGESKGLHEVMLAMEKSGVAFQFLTQVRNKAMDAYQEIMRMQV